MEPPAVEQRVLSGGTVLVGTSRLLFDVQLPVWERLAGTRPIQLSLEGTSPLPVLEELLSMY